MPNEDVVELDRGWTLWRTAALRTAGLPFDRLAVLAEPPGLTGRPPAERAAALRRSGRDAFDALLDDDTLRSALTWQNPAALDTWAGAYLAARRAGERPSLHRLAQRQAVVARYAQRYCAKNDTIGFFGPVAWADLGGGPTGWRGSGGLRRSTVYVEVWAVRTIARAWAADPRLTPHLPVRVDPSCTVDGELIRRPHRSPLRMSARQHALIGELAGRDDRLAAVAERAGIPAAEAAAELAALVAEHAVMIGFRVPVSSFPLDALAEQVREIGDPGLRAELLGRLEPIRRAAREIAAAARPDELRTSLAAGDRALAEAAGQALAGVTGRPGGRTPLYLDCRRDLDATIGPELLAELTGPLAILLDSARWLCAQIGEAATEALTARYRHLAAQRDEVTVADLHLAAADILLPGGTFFTDVVTDFQLRWAQIIDGQHSVPLDRARALADALFRADEHGWAAARLHSPDLMLRNSDNGPRWVLGELHIALNTLESRFFLAQADDSDGLTAATAKEFAPGRVVPIYPGSARDVSSRSYPPLGLDPPGHYRYVSFGADEGHPSGARSTPSTALIVTEESGELVATCPGDGWAAPVLECFGEFLSAVAVTLFRLRAPRPYAPRIAIGGLTVCRRTWQVPAAEFAGLPSHAKDPGQDRLRSLAAGWGVPRHAFARVPGDTKPFYVDFAAPLTVDNLARAGRRAAAGPPGTVVELVEMLPAPDELWLRLPDGACTSELRMVAVDPTPAVASSRPLRTAAAAGERGA